MKNPYDKKDTVLTYEDAWSYPDDAVERLANLIVENSESQQHICILDIGIGTGSLSLNLADKLNNKSRSCSVDAFDISHDMVKKTKENRVKYNVECEAINYDAAKGLPQDFSGKEYNVVIATFVLHYLDDLTDTKVPSWQYLLKKAVERLHDGGFLIQAEVLEEMGAVDGLSPLDLAGAKIKTPFTLFWEKYFEYRKPAWNPDLRPSSYQKVFEWLAEQGSKLSLVPFSAFVYEEEKQVDLDEMITWISSGQFSSLASGLDQSMRNELVKRMKTYSCERNLKHNHIFPIIRAARFILHQKTSDQFGIYRTASESLFRYKDRYGIHALPLDNGYLIPIKNNKIDLTDDEDKEALTAFLEECIIPLIGADFLDCELCLYDFLGDEKKWGSIARVRPEFQKYRDAYTRSIKSKSFIEKVYQKNLSHYKTPSSGTPSFIRIYLCQESTPALSTFNQKWDSYKPVESEKEIIFAHNSLLGENESLYVYYIMTTFCPPDRRSDSGSLSIGALILVRKTEINDQVLRLLQVSVSEITNPIGAAYLRSAQLRQTKKAARAAVFARNFSHITGSHIVSNPEFRHSLAGNELLRSFRSRLYQNIDSFIAAENDLLTYMFDGNQQPEDAFSAAAKELADVRDKLGTGDVLLENTRRFHEYLQGRFDFIARAIDDLRDQPEPVWLVKDLLEGFLSQTAYLDNLVADVGLRRDDMEFFLRIGAKDQNVEYVARWAPQTEATDSVQYPLDVIWEKSNNPGVRIKPEKMVSLPGGMGSAHAFYSLLENIIRNSAKYGTLKEGRAKRKEKYKLTLQVSQMSEKDGKPLYQLISIWDNYSLAVYGEAETFRQIQTRLEKDFVRDDGQAEGDDLGMMEMQACAKFLCRENKGLYPGERPSHVINENALQDERRRFNLWTSSLEESQRIDPENPPLVFQMAFNKTTLMACCTPKANENRSTQHFKLVYWVKQLSEVRILSPFLLVLDGSQPSSDILNTLTQDQTAYPQRIVVMCSDQETLNEWKTVLVNSRLPRRRIVCLMDKAVYTKIFPASPVYDDSEEEEAILAGYQAWLKAWKPLPLYPNSENPAGEQSQQWHLWIGLQRQGSQVKEAWGNAHTYFSDDSLVKVMVASFSANDNAPFKTESTNTIYVDGEEKYWVDETNSPEVDKKALVFDNHGNCFQAAQKGVNSLSKSTRFFQKLSGSVSPDLFRLLSSPPQDEFSFKFFVYSLVESCLTNVLVVDERLAMALLEGRGGGKINESFSSDLLEHQKAGVYPVFRFRHETDAPSDEEIGFYTPEHKKRLAALIANKSSESVSNEIMAQEGIILDVSDDVEKNNKAEFNLLTSVAKGDSFGLGLCNNLEADVILIHEGAMDLLVGKGIQRVGEESDEQLQKQLQALYQLAPMIVRTSGRGRKSKLLGEHLPFIEFTQVSSALLTARNKFALVRALLGSVGRTMGGV